MTITQIEYFISLAKTLNFTRTAEECCVSQPVVSQQILALETDLGFKLFSRTTRGVRLTDAGLTFYHNVSEGLDQINTAKARATTVAHGQSGELTIGVFGGAQFYGLRDIAQFHTANPDILLHFTQASPRDQYEELKAGRFDIVYSSYSFMSRFGDVYCFNPQTWRINAVVSKHHPLANRRQISEHEALQYTALLSERGYYEMTEGLVDYPATSKIEHYLTCETFDIKLLMVQLNLGIAFFPEGTLDYLPQDVRMIRIKEAGWNLTEAWCCLASNKNHALQRLVEFLKDHQEQDF